MRLAFDMSAYLWNAVLAGKDRENGTEVTFNDKPVWINSAQYGYDIVMGTLLRDMEQAKVKPHNCLLVFEGLHSKKRRQAIEAGYKGGAGKAPEAYVQFEKMLAMVEEQWLAVGAISMRQPYVEGDDVLAYLARETKQDLRIATFDNDLAALHGTTNKHGITVQVMVNGVVGYNKYGDFSFPLITLYKSLVGDDGDKIKGCPQFGVKSWDGLRLTYGDEGLEYFLARLAAGSLGDIHEKRDEDPLVRKICDEEAQVLRSYQLAKLHPEWVNTRQTALELKAGMVKPYVTDVTDYRLRAYAGEQWLVTRDNWEERADHFRQHLRRSPSVALDIETSTPPESDEWLAQQVPPDPDGVDVLGSTLTGLSLTYGNNLQFTIYISVDHALTDNVTSEEVRQLVAEIHAAGKETVIQNVSFELTVLYNEWGAAQEDNGWEGFLPNCLDTKMEASYVNENIPNGLKGRSKEHLGYTQTSYAETTQRSGPLGTLRKGGRQLKEYNEIVKPAVYWHNGAQVPELEALALDKQGEVVEFDEAVTEVWETRQYKMNELTAEEVAGYGCDDTICTASLHNFYQLVMELEGQYEVYKRVEIDAAYMSAVGFLQGTDFSLAKMKELEADDEKVWAAAWVTLRAYLMSKAWPGSVCPVFSSESKPADFKVAFEIVTGRKLDTSVRKIDKLAKLMEAEGAELLAQLLVASTASGDWQLFNEYVARHFKGEPQFNTGSYIQKGKLMYEMMDLPVKMRGELTDEMRAKGKTEGTPKTDALAIDWAKKFDAKEEDKPVLEALKLMLMVSTRQTLYYNKYPGFIHWKTGKLHSSLNQCQANTRRSSESGPNKQQLPKHPKIEGQKVRFREVIVPHRPNAVIVSLDESSQELRLIAHMSQDPNMLACYIGDNKKDMHSLTGVGIAKWKFPDRQWSYETYVGAVKSEDPSAKECRVLGKKVNFTTEYGAQAPKVALTLLVSEAEAQVFIDAKLAAFPRAAEWKDEVIEEARKFGQVLTLEGAVRHLREALNSNDSYEASKAERQAVNFEVQGSAAEQTKLAYGAAWKRRLVQKYDCVFIGPIHDEVVWSVALEDLAPFLVEMHACMVQPYGGMTVPIESSISIGPNFGDQIELGDLPTTEAIVGGLAALVSKHKQYGKYVEPVITAETRGIYDKAMAKILAKGKAVA